MAIDNQTPSINPADRDSLAGTLRLAIGKALSTMENALPAVVVSYDRASNRAVVRPLVRLLTTDGQAIDRPSYADTPVYQIGAGGFVLHFPLTAGDFGYLHACDRDTSLALQGMASASPNTIRIHSFSDGFFLPTVISGHSIAGEDAGAVCLQAIDGTTRLSMHAGYAKMTAENGLMVADADGEPEEGALFDVSSTLKASIPWPRMTMAQRDAIPSPKSGMAVWLLPPDDRLSTYSETGGAWS